MTDDTRSQSGWSEASETDRIVFTMLSNADRIDMSSIPRPGETGRASPRIVEEPLPTIAETTEHAVQEMPPPPSLGSPVPLASDLPPPPQAVLSPSRPVAPNHDDAYYGTSSRARDDAMRHDTTRDTVQDTTSPAPVAPRLTPRRMPTARNDISSSGGVGTTFEAPAAPPPPHYEAPAAPPPSTRPRRRRTTTSRGSGGVDSHLLKDEDMMANKVLVDIQNLESRDSHDSSVDVTIDRDMTRELRRRILAADERNQVAMMKNGMRLFLTGIEMVNNRLGLTRSGGVVE